MSVTEHSWYSGRGTFRNGNFAGRLDRVLGEALACKMARRAETPAPFLDDALRSSTLRLQCAHCGLDELRGDPSPSQVVPDQGVPPSPVRRAVLRGVSANRPSSSAPA